MIVLDHVSKKSKISKKQKNKEIDSEKKSKEIAAVNRVSFTCKPGRIFTLLGPNGAGKTTLLRMIATMLKPSEGTILVNGFDTGKKGKHVRAVIGFLTGATGLYHRLTAEETVKYFADLHFMEKDKFLKRKESLFTTLGINEFTNQRIDKLSTGMKQKVSIARTMIHDPDVVIFDEPTSGLDVVTSRSIISLIHQCKEQGKTVIFSTHRMDEVSLLSDDLAIIHKGNLLFCDEFSIFKKSMKSASIEEEFIRILEGEMK